MSDNKLDQFFRNKLGQTGPVDFNPVHWEEARQMMKNKNDRNLLWLFLVVVFLAFLGAFYYFSSSKDLVPIHVNQEPNQDMAHEELINNNGDLMNDGEDSRDDSSQEFITNNEAQIPAKKINTGVSVNPRSQASNDRVLQKSGDFSSSTPGQNSPIPVEESARLITDVDSLAANSSLEKTAPLIAEALRIPLEIPMLGVPPFALDYRYALEENGSNLRISRERISRKRYAWSGTLLLNPANTQGLSVQGLLLGFTYERYVSANWFVGLRPSLQLQTNQNGFSKFEQVTTYSFSAINTTYGLQAENLQFFSAPVYLGLESGKHSIELGLSLDLLLAARGKLQQVAIEDQSISTVQNLGSGWIETGDMQRLSTNLFLGYKNAVSQRLKTGITFFYNPAKLYPGLPNNQPQITNARWYLGWQANYYIN